MSEYAFKTSRAHLLRGSALMATMLAGLAAGAAHAQDAPASATSPTPVAAPTQTAAATPQQGGLEDIVVTARKRAESVQDVPVAITAISSVQVQRRDLTSLEKISASTPQFTVGRASNGAGASLTLRGIGSPSTSIGVEQSVAVVVDGVYYGQGRVINEGFFDLDRIEILKGPQALFFGKNATAGVISLTSADPGSKPEYIFRAGYEFGAKQGYGEAIASIPLTDTLGIRVALRGSKMWGGYYKNRGTDTTYTTTDAATGVSTVHDTTTSAKDQPQEKEAIGRLTVKWTPTDRLTVNLKGSGTYNNTAGNGWNYVIARCATGSSTLNPSYGCGSDFVIHQNNIPLDIAKVLPHSKSDGALYNTYKSYQGTGTINYKLDDLTLTSVTNYNWNNNKFACACDFQSSPTGTWATEDASFHAFSEEARALSNFDFPINFMVGGLYQATRRDFQQWVLFAGSENSAADPANRYVSYSKLSATEGRTYSGFGQLIWKILPKVEVTGGVRYTHETKRSFFEQPYVNPLLAPGGALPIFIPAGAPGGVVNANQTFNNWSPEATITYKPARDIMFYGSYRTAYKSGGFSNSAINSNLSDDPPRDFQFKPETAAGFEIGAKTTLLDNQLRFNLNLYTFKYSDLQVDYFNSQIFAYQTYNAGSARTKGIELELEYAPRSIPGLTLSGTANYNHARYGDFLAPCWAGQHPDQGCTLVGPAGAPFQQLAGQPTSIAPTWTASAGASYEKTLDSGIRLGFNVDTRYSGSYFGSSFANPNTVQHSYWMLDAGIRVGREDSRWEVALIGKNLTNHFYFLGASDGPSTGSGTGTPGGIIADQLGLGNTPRTVALQFTVKY
ncbi:TonB-dependent receptor [Sphingomonas oryzagri]